MPLTWILLIGCLIVWFVWESKKSKTRSSSQSDSISNGIITEDTVFKAQAVLEKQFEHIYRPDAFSGQEIYIYRSLMTPWFSQLASDNRYKDDMSKKLRSDFLEYMAALQERRTCSYLGMESEDQAARDAYWEEGAILSRKLCAIEDGFASAIGSEAVKELKHIRSLGFNDFNHHGEKAPKGFEYDLENKLKPRNKKI